MATIVGGPFKHGNVYLIFTHISFQMQISPLRSVSPYFSSDKNIHLMQRLSSRSGADTGSSQDFMIQVALGLV